MQDNMAGPRHPKIAMAAYTFDAGRGGVARVARLLRDSVKAADGCRLSAVTCAREGRKAGAASYPAFLLRTWLARWSHTHFIYDSPNMARVHDVLPAPRRPRLVFAHGVEIWEQARPSWIHACHNADVLVVNSHYTRDRAETLHGGFARAHVCHLATETSDPVQSMPVAEKPPHALIVARMDAQEDYKGHRELITCWPSVCDEVPGATLHIVGNGSARAEYEHLAAGLGLDESIVFHGFVSEEDLARLYRDSSLFAMPSRGEGFGLVYIESMRHGLPVIASRHDAAQEIVLDGKTGYTVDLDRPRELPARLIELLGSPEMANRMGQAGQSRWKDHFTAKAFHTRFAPILNEFLATTTIDPK